jgi:hypothetical protein
MAIERQKKVFSKRQGYRSQPKEIIVWEDAPESLRHFVLETAVQLGYGPYPLRDSICSVLRVRPNSNNWSEYPNVWGEAESFVYGCDWFQFYDFVERIYQGVSGRWTTDHGGEGVERAKQFQEAINEFFVDEGIGWQLIDGEIVTRGTETFESNVHGAVEALETAGRITARDEIHEALLDLSRRPDADLTGAVQHAMAALECVARDVCNDKRATLGEVINDTPAPFRSRSMNRWPRHGAMHRRWRGTFAKAVRRSAEKLN